ncbi:hypothetical protein YC2023_042461 [Brassica napus]
MIQAYDNQTQSIKKKKLYLIDDLIKNGHRWKWKPKKASLLPATQTLSHKKSSTLALLSVSSSNPAVFKSSSIQTARRESDSTAVFNDGTTPHSHTSWHDGF